MSAEIESMFYTREKPWHGLGTRVENAPTSEAALSLAGLDWKVIQKTVITEDGLPVSGFKDIRKTMSYDLENKPVENSPKTRTSMRNIPLNQNIINILEKQKQQTVVLNMERKIRALDDYVIKSPNNLPVRDIRRLNEAIHRIVAKIRNDGYDFPDISCHSLRATFTTRAIDAGMSPQTLKEILGHADYKMTMDLYYHSTSDIQKQEMEKLETAFIDAVI